MRAERLLSNRPTVPASGAGAEGEAVVTPSIHLSHIELWCREHFKASVIQSFPGNAEMGHEATHSEVGSSCCW